MKTVIGTFNHKEEAEKAISNLRSKGFDKEISIISKDYENKGKYDHFESKGTGAAFTNDSISDGATTGGVIGGIAGLAVGAGALAIPGIGPIIAAGPIAGLLSGAATGGIAGGLIDWGIPEDRSSFYEEKVKTGELLVSVRTHEEKIDDAASILRHNGANNVESH